MEHCGKIFVEICINFKESKQKHKLKRYKIKMAEDMKTNLLNSVKEQVTQEKTISVETGLDRLSRETSKSLVEKFALDESIPVNLDELLNHYDVTLHEVDFSELEKTVLSQRVEEKGLILGAVAEVDKKIRILYRQSDRPHRQRFTIAHELAHCCINSTELAEYGHIEFRTDMHSKDINSIEHKANIFAGELLIPEKSLLEIYKSTEKPEINYLARLFDVSLSVMQARLEHLKLPFRVHRLDF